MLSRCCKADLLREYDYFVCTQCARPHGIISEKAREQHYDTGHALQSQAIINQT